RTTWFAHVKKSAPISEALRRALPDIQPYAFGFAGRGKVPPGFIEPSAYAGALLWPFALAGLFSRRREAWALATVGLLGAAVGARLPIVTDAISKLPLFDIGINERMVFLAAFATCGLAALGAERLREEGGRLFPGLASLACLAMVSLLYLRSRPRFASLELPSEFFRDRFLYQTVPLAAAALLWLLLPRRRAAVAIAGCLVALLVERGFEEGDVNPTFPSSTFYPRLASLEKIPRNEPWRMTAVGLIFIPNIAALYELEDVRGYEAMTFLPLMETFPLWCVHQPVWFNRVDDPTRPFLSFLNVRWVLLSPDAESPPGWPVLFRGAEGVLVENPSVLPRAFAPRTFRAEPDRPRRLELLQTISDFRERGVISESGSEEGWRQNGDATVAVAEYSAQKMRLAIDARTAALVGTSMTDWPGWKLRVDGRPAATLTYNHAFVGFRVPAGRHEASLEYRPDSVSTGGAVSLASLLLSLVLLRFPRRPVSSGPR
ncbi:MAG: YfhO family protein, partial [Acidobacteriota bacterium]|nr:YfhO family protein [Acidobacteriota bacterium]